MQEKFSGTKFFEVKNVEKFISHTTQTLTEYSEKRCTGFSLQAREKFMFTASELFSRDRQAHEKLNWTNSRRKQTATEVRERWSEKLLPDLRNFRFVLVFLRLFVYELNERVGLNEKVSLWQYFEELWIKLLIFRIGLHKKDFLLL